MALLRIRGARRLGICCARYEWTGRTDIDCGGLVAMDQMNDKPICPMK